MRNTQIHNELARDIAHAKASMADTVARTRRTIAETRALLEGVSRIPDER